MKTRRFRFNGFHVVAPWIVRALTLSKYIIAITLFPFVFYKNEHIKANRITRVHESIHIRQQMECALVGITLGLLLVFMFGVFIWAPIIGALLFYPIYGIEFLVRLIIYRNWDAAYENIAFEAEAYMKSNVPYYLDLRKPFAWVKFWK